MSEQNRKLTERWFQEVWNEGREETINELLALDSKCFGYPLPDSFLDFEGYKQAWRDFQSTFSEVHFVIDDMLAEGNRVSLRWTMTGKHAGEGLGFKATSLPVKLQGAAFALWQEGRITHGWNFVNLAPTIDRLRTAAEKL